MGSSHNSIKAQLVSSIAGAVVGSIITGGISYMINFSNQDTIKKNTVETLSIYFDSVDKDMSYEEALQTIYKDSESLKQEIEILNKQIVDESEKSKQEIVMLKEQLELQQSQIDQQNSQEEINEIIQSATEYWNNSDYIQSLTLLKNSKAKSLDIAKIYEQYSEKYVEYLLSQADLLVSERKYNDAVEILKKGKGITSNDKKLNDKINSINSNQPIKLSDLKISTSRFFYQSQDRQAEDTVGNRYSTGNLFITYAEGEKNYGYATFYLGQKYTSLTGIIAVSDESENRSDTQLKGWIEIGTKDGDKFNQLWTSPILSRATSQIEIPETDLSESEWLEIRYYNNGEYWNLAAGYHSLRVIISDVMIYSD